MGQPVKLSDVLVLDARLTGEIAERSIAGQIEYWANLGRAIEPLLQGNQALALCQQAAARPLSECLASADTPKGRKRLDNYLETLPFPHYEPAPHKPGFLVRIDETGKRTLGRFVNRQFQAAGSGEELILPLDQRPIIVALAGSNGAGKTTFYHAHLQPTGLRLVNADVLARALGAGAYAAAKMAAALRQRLVEQGESFVFETVFSDPVGDKLTFLKDAMADGYHVVLCFIGIGSPATSDQRVAMRVSQGGHDVPLGKLIARFPRTLANLAAAIPTLPHVLVFDNDDLKHPYKKVAVFENGKATFLAKPSPAWLAPLLR